MMKEPKNYRQVYPRCCANCSHRIPLTGLMDGFSGCEREKEDDRGFDGEEMYQYVCDYFKP